MNRTTASVARVAQWVAQWAGTSRAFLLALAVVLAWAVTGPLFHFSDSWLLVINTGTSVVTFLMVFLIQRSQNKDAMAIHIKLNELIAAVHGASNRLLNVEHLSEEEVHALHSHFRSLSELAKDDKELTMSHSVEEAVGRYEEKMKENGGKQVVS